MSFNPYEVLGVEPTATAEEIQAAYRRAAAQAHPDREGGSTERMTDVNMAYKILSDAEAKARYDRGEGTQTGHSVDDRARDMLLQCLRVAIRNAEVHFDLVDLLRQAVEKQLEQLRAVRLKTQDDIAKVREFVRRLKGPPENPFHSLLAQEIARGEEMLPVFDKDEAMMHRCLELLVDYSYDTAEDVFKQLLIQKPGGAYLTQGETA